MKFSKNLQKVIKRASFLQDVLILKMILKKKKQKQING